MNTRIRYTKLNNNTEIESNIFKVNKLEFFIHINLISKQYYILDRSLNTHVNGNGKSLSELKKLAKQSLIDLGIEFKSEVRLNKNSIVDIIDYNE